MAKQNREGFTLVELLVVITIIGILVSLLLPAVNAAREAARKSDCRNNLHQIALAIKAHLAEHGHYPTGGWGKGELGSGWAGDPDRGYSRRQPGGWCYNILPYIGESVIHDMGDDRAIRTPLKLYYCMTRRTTRAFPYKRSDPYNNASVSNGIQVGKTDYAMCAGSSFPGSTEFHEPSSPPETDDGEPWSTEPQNGVSYYRSEVKDSHIEDGESNQYMVGEKYLGTRYYETGESQLDDESWNVGFTFDIYRWAQKKPLRDRGDDRDSETLLNGQARWGQFGGPHPSGWQVAFCDGSVHSIAWGLKLSVHRCLGERNDGAPIDRSEF